MIKRGEIYYIEPSKTLQTTGSEQRSNRPGIIVSNDGNNEHASTVEVVYLTTQQKREMPTHVIINSASRQSTALCEQVHSIAVERLADYMGQCTETEMQEVNEALMISLGISADFQDESVKDTIIQKLNKKVLRLKTKNKAYRSIIKEVIRGKID